RDPSDNVSVGSLGGSTIRSQTSIPSQLPPFGAVPHVTRETVRKTPQTVTFPMGVTSGSGIGRGGGRNAEFFSAPMDTPDAEIQEDVGVICPKHLRGAPGSKDYKYNHEAATCSLQHQFGVAKHFVSSITGETEEGNAKEEQHVQDMFVANLSKIEDLDVRLIQFDMKRPFLMSTMKSGVDVDAITHVAELWNDDEIDLIHDWEKIDWDTVLYWQYSINKRCDAVDKDSNKWALQLVFNSCTADLREQINLRYKDLPPVYQGAAVYVWIMYYFLFAKSRNTTEAMKKFLKIVKSKGLSRVPHENVVIFRKEVLAVCRRLYASGDLPEETTEDILEALKKSSVKKFRDLFESYAQEATKYSLELNPSGSRPWGHDNVLEEVMYFLNKAVEYYHNLHTAHQWNIPKGHKFSAALSHTLGCSAEGGSRHQLGRERAVCLLLSQRQWKMLWLEQ
ncbi:hypothetical protein ACHAXS_006228, partial [Conticribra weissflogii]